MGVGRTVRSLWLATIALTATVDLIPSLAFAQVITDGTTGSGVPLDLQGPNYQITDDLGTRADDNLFHSFRDFSIRTGESATFSGPDEIENVISRVTGENPSDIDGILSSTMPEADFYLINPNGVTFGPNAQLDVQGSFHVSTADELRFADGAAFSAANPDASGFSMAAPSAFGFLDAAPSNILVDRGTLEVGEDETLSLVGGDIKIDAGSNGTFGGGDDGLLRVESGTINLLALGGEGEAEIATGDVVGGSGGEVTLVDQAHIDTSGDGGGLIRIRSTRLDVRGESRNAPSLFTANNLGAQDSTGGINIDTGVLQIEDARIESNASDAGKAGDITISSDEMTLKSASIESASNGIFTPGSAGDVAISAQRMSMSEGAEIRSSASSTGDAGDVLIEAEEHLLMTGFSTIRSTVFRNNVDSSENGQAGNVSIETNALEMQGGASITTTTFGASAAGRIDVTAKSLLMDGNGVGGQTATRITSNAGLVSLGNAGEIFIDAGIIEMRGGDQNEVAPDSTGAAEGAIISTSVGLASNGIAGGVTIKADLLDVDHGRIASSSNQSSSAADAGGVTIEANKIKFAESSILTEADLSQGGQIDIKARDYAVFTNSDVISNGAVPSENASIIDIQGDIIALNNSRIFSLTGDGQPITGSGTVNLAGDAILISVDSVVDASSSIEVTGLISDFANQLINLESEFTDPSRLLRSACESGGDLGGSSFVATNAGTRLSAEGLQSGFYKVNPNVDGVSVDGDDPSLRLSCP